VAAKQSITVDYLVAETFDGVTNAPEVTLGETPTDPDSQIYQPGTAEALGLIDPDLGLGGSIGPRCISQLVVGWTGDPGPPGSGIWISSIFQGAPVRLLQIADLAGQNSYVRIEAPFVIPQGAVLEIDVPGVQFTGSSGVRITADAPQDVCELLALLQIAEGGGVTPPGSGCPCLVYDAQVATQGQVFPLTPGTIRLFNAAALQNGDMTLQMPPPTTDNQQVAVKEIGVSTVEVTIDGNGSQVELPGFPAAPFGPVSLPRAFWLWQYDAKNGIWRLR